MSNWLPKPSGANQQFFDGAASGLLRLQRCDDCERWAFPVKDRCQGCGGTDMGWQDASGFGTLYSFGLLHRVYHPRHEGRLPLILANVDLAEGIRIPSNVVGVSPTDLTIGMALTVDFETLPDGIAIPVFRPAQAG